MEYDYRYPYKSAASGALPGHAKILLSVIIICNFYKYRMYVRFRFMCVCIRINLLSTIYILKMYNLCAPTLQNFYTT